MDPKRLLFVLVGAVPFVVLGSAAASVVLLRAGYGALVWAVLPLLGGLLVAAVLGLILGRAAGGQRGPDNPSGGHSGEKDPENDKPGKRNDV